MSSIKLSGNVNYVMGILVDQMFEIVCTLEMYRNVEFL